MANMADASDTQKINADRLFLASCIALIATAMSFAIRGDIMADFESVFSLNKTNVGWIAGAAFWGFGLSIFIGGPLCDALGMGNIIRLAAAGHIGGAILTIFAPNFTVLFLATLLVGIANGLVEAACNPLIATIYPEKKTQKLTLFHAWFPGGIVIGGLLCVALNQTSSFGPGSALGWKVKMALLLIPAVIYTVMILGEKFPPTERKAAGVSFSEMFTETLRQPLFWLVWVMMWLTAATELGPGQWITNIYNQVMGSRHGAGVLLLVWGSGLMWALRQFVSGIAHKFTPVSLIAFTAPFAAVGLFLCNIAKTPLMWFIASGLLYFGVCFWWPTMLGITSERFPRTGAFGLALIGGTGSISTAVAGPVMGLINDKLGPEKVLPIWAILPVVICIVFFLIYLSDRAKGGYRVEKIQ
ncbi:MAG TPA: MFS transporter [Candidatus Hydrogenedentes bacterium]|nr:MFS transporter [Candidatus Hydrogenedentota bacterium]HOL77312.1 MFS transporter [Candidatus Hydrogenedentota bacterium]HPO85955.1 MFS transporter [Candidatus Hydrogenedentota bacterium]